MDSDECPLQPRSSSLQVHLDELYQMNTFLFLKYLPISPKSLKNWQKKLKISENFVESDRIQLDPLSNAETHPN